MGNECCKSGDTGGDIVVPNDSKGENRGSGNDREEEPQAEPSTDLRDEPQARGSGLELVFNSKEKVIQKFPENDSAALDKKVEASAIIRAWYGDPSQEWHGKNGQDVTATVKQLINDGKEVTADSNLLGNPASKVRKVLLIERYEWQRKSYVFDKKPLAITFEDKKTPIVVTKLTKSGHGFARGVKIGMVLIEVNGEDITGLSYKESFQKIQLGLESLPKN